ncbi:transcription termination factor Rho [Leucobacter massiliensis]|uniref:Transcription termination factor Rho n=1 Tax=Leucobacter massiliensis TaxID=1686285 RepID=A0A2S9QKQ9_9MICO|nr:transcription termination factor Rho [Leucobacter massiliensis]PRI10174.1 transcription termination factor Rho [Leucobacter massiliensis]
MESNEENTSTPAEETAPVRRRASRRVSAAAGAAGETVVTEAASAAADTASAPAAETPAAEAPKKRASRSRKKAAEEPAAEAAPAAASTEAASTEAASTDAASTEAPASTEADAPEAAEAPKKRASRSRKKAAEEPAAEAAEAAGEPATAAEQSPEAPAAEQAPAKRGRGRRAQSGETAAQDAPARAQAEDAQADAAQSESAPAEAARAEEARAEEAKPAAAKGDSDQGSGESDKPGRNRRGRGRGQKSDAAESGEAGEQSAAGEEGKGRGQAQNGERGEKNGERGDKNGEGSARSSRTRQRDRKRRGQGDDLEPEITEDDVLLPIAGILDVLDNYAFVRTSGYLPGTSDVYVSLGQVKKYSLRRGDAVVGAIRQPREGEGGGRQKYNAIVKVDSINGRPVDESEKRPEVAELTPVFPQERLRLETGKDALLGRAIDLVAPVGLGQRSLLVLPARQPGAPLLGELAQAVTANAPEAHLMLVLTNAQPEEATQLQRTVSGEVVAASFDRPAEDQATVAELAIERAKRLVELGHDVVVLLDSLNGLAHAYAQAQHASARPALGELDEFAIGQVKRLLAAARKVENAGSLTVMATVHAKTGVDADKMLLREVLAVANQQLRFEKTRPGAAPVVDLAASYTRGAEAQLGAAEAAAVATVRAALHEDDGAEKVLARLRSTDSNAALLAEAQRTGKF